MIDQNIMSLDMEYNQPSQSIIQIGIAVGNLQTGVILESASYYIKVNEQISEFIVGLTGITDQHIEEEGISLEEAYQHICQLHTEYKCFRNCLTWGGGDSDDLRRALRLDNEKYIFGRRWIDAKTCFVSRCFALGLKHQSGLGKSMQRMGLEFQGRKHDAKYDAINTFLLYRRLLEKFKDE